ncbi:MAG: YfhO family protein [Magnetococcales bacterium]|nr:YfhO family protein [Magnetococcales bacterium]
MRVQLLRTLLLPPTQTDPPPATGDPKLPWLLFWLGWSLLTSAIYWILGPHSYLRIQDNADFNIPLRITAARDILDYGLTFWQPKFSSGMPALLHPQVDSFLIDGLPYLMFPAWAVYGFVMWLQRFLAGYFTFRLCREILKFDTTAALFSGMAFSLYFWNVQDAKLVEALGLPAVALTFLWFEGILALPAKRGMLLALLLGLLTGLVAQSVIYTFFVMMGLPFWFLIVRETRLSQGWSRFVSFGLGITLAEAPQLLALMTYSPSTTRGQTTLFEIPIPSLADMTHHVWTILGWATLPQNGLYWGLFILGMVVARGEKKWAWRLLAISLLCGIGSEIGHWIQSSLPRFIPPSRGNLLDFNQFFIFLGPLLGGAGLHLARRQAHACAKPVRTLIILATGIALLMPLVGWKEITRKLLHRLSTDNYAVHFENPVMQRLGALSRQETTPFRVASVGTWAPTVASASGGRIYPAVANAYGLESVDGYFRLHSARYHRFWRRIVAKSLAVYPTLQDRTIKWYYLFKQPEERFASRAPLVLEDWFNPELLSLANARFLISQWPLRHPALTLWHEPKAELAAGRAWEALRLREKIWRAMKGDMPDNALYVYENQSVVPRLFLPASIRIFDGQEALLDAMAQTGAKDLAQTAFLEANDFPQWTQTPPRLTPGEATFTRYTPDHLEVTTRSTGSSMLVLTNAFDPYWRVTVNGTPGTILPVDHAFQGIVLPAGENRLVLDYYPPYRLTR